MTDITLVENPTVGAASMRDGSPVIMDALTTNNCRLSFPSLPGVVFMLQTVSLPDVYVNEVKQNTRYVDPNEVGEKLNFSPFAVTFIVDKYMKNWSAIYNWMKRMTVAGSNVDEQDNPVLIINNTEVLRFIGAWPTRLGGLDFDATADGVEYMKATLNVNYDYFDYIGEFATVDSVYK